MTAKQTPASINALPTKRAGSIRRNSSSTCPAAVRVSSICASVIPRERYTPRVSSIACCITAGSSAKGLIPKRSRMSPPAIAFPTSEAIVPPTRARSVPPSRRNRTPSASPVGANESTKEAPATGVAKSMVRRSDAAAASTPQRSPMRTVTNAINTGQSIPIIIVSTGR